ncbi:putative secreted protein with C-terminal beta-propeller domain [Bacillus pakistanensis]|uniref:Secreted protein with C-terminal beta-propeller domain n=1 Tax=Rossellomorea pakistanensis TaxID=992288 RepID=A0ABS2NET9_9BACI|nr:beta-propeller domain-containing protein [Bacillus pakistanensis]MBM7586279.1 putative secreted protein with C-terminal beta-propeller domain [Bacillus pakistanensis]
MKKYSLIYSCIAVVALICFGLFFFFQKPSVSAGIPLDERSVVLSNKSWDLQFSTSMDKDSVNKENVYVTDNNGKKVPVTLDLSKDGKHLKIHPPKDGYSLDPEYFTLHLGSSVKSTWGLSIRRDKNIEFAVVPSLPTVKSKEHLKKYFLTALKEEKNRPSLLGKTEERSDSNGTPESANSATLSQEKSTAAEFSGTNNQVQGVDEGDRVKTDGKYIYHMTDGKLIITKAAPAENLEIASQTEFKQNFSPMHLFIHENTLLVIGNSWESYQDNLPRTKNMIMPIDGMTTGYIYDISNKQKPKLLREIGMEGHYVTSRMIDSQVYLISNHYPNHLMLEQNEDIDLRPRIMDSLANEEPTRLDIDKIKYMPQSQEKNFTMFGSLDLNKPNSEMHVESYLGSGEQIYMSEDHLYIAVSKYFYENNGEWSPPNTEIYKFNVNNLDVQFASMGEVPGTVLNQFSMDEHEGYFRVATTQGEMWNDDKPSANNLYILDKNMKQVGEVENLARGERIYSVRFMGDRAYIVTFKQVDPLFVIDTANPSNPKVLGELKIPGFSTYLHPYDENHIIGFGQDTRTVKDPNGKSEEPIVMRGGMKISLFDITDFNNPKEADMEIIGGQGTHSELLHNHKALMHHPEKDLFAFPVSIYQDGKKGPFDQEFAGQGALIYEISPENGIVQKAKLINDEEKAENWEDQIQRILYIDNQLYTISNNAVSAYDLNSFKSIESIKIQ